ncbi:MAG: recombination mediator RecR [Candidatus Cloacimonetes bacterium]|nr:recombination mediator RecR [Candidatus Cloacimonadota bacterium]
MLFHGSLGELQKHLKQLPGIGAKTAQRLALHLVASERELALGLADSLRLAVADYHACPRCLMLTDAPMCAFCADENRDDTRLCVVESTLDVYLLEQTGEYHGRYFVLGGLLSPLDGVGPDEIHLPELLELLRSRQVEEVILALNPSTEGESTIDYLGSLLAELPPTVTRLSTGIPFGGDIGYTSQVTLSNALLRRFSIE